MPSLATVLIVESDSTAAQEIRSTLGSLPITCTLVHTLAKAFEVIDLTKYDFVIVSREMTDGDGIELAEYLQDSALKTKVVLVTKNKCQVIDRIEAYKLGVYEVFQKPLILLELKYKIANLLHVQKITPGTTINYGNIKLNPLTGTLHLGDSSETHLRKKESEILSCLLRHRPKIVTKDMIIDYVWSDCDEPPTHSTIDVYIRRLRSRMGSSQNLIKTARGYGYYIAE